MKKLIPIGVFLALVFVPAVASAQLPIDVTASPTKDTGGWVYGMAQLLALLGVLMLVLVVAGFMRWSPRWAEAKRKKAAAGPPPAKAAAPALAPPVAVSSLAVEAAEASAASIGEKAHAPESGAVPVVATPSAPAQVAPAQVAPAQVAPETAAPPASATSGVYETTLKELLDKGVPQKVAEARAKMAAKKAGG